MPADKFFDGASTSFSPTESWSLISTPSIPERLSLKNVVLNLDKTLQTSLVLAVEG
jgi:hypothetical protein